MFGRGPSDAPTPTSLIPRLDGPNAAAAAASPAASKLRFACRDGCLCEPLSSYRETAEESKEGPTGDDRSETHIQGTEYTETYLAFPGPSCLPPRQ